MKKVALIMAIVIATALMTACADKEHKPVDSDTVVSTLTVAPTQRATGTPTEALRATATPAATKKAEPSATISPQPTLSIEQAAMMAKYVSVLQQVYSEQKFPDGEDRGFFEDDDITTNNFAIYDIDGDQKEELIIEYTTTYTAGQETIIYDYDAKTDTVVEEFLEFPFLTFYENGIIKAGWSHNHGLAGDSFWPYTLYQYDSASDTYTEVGLVDAWDKSFSAEDYEGNAFPQDLDLDGDGVLYYIDVDGIESLVDAAEYNQWLKAYIYGAKVIELPYMSLTEENINSIIR